MGESLMVGWLSGWKYRKSHVINPSQGAGSNYQIRITVHYGSGVESGEHVYLNGKCRSDFGDIRFTASDGETLLSYWIEKVIDGDYAIFWVKISDDLSENPVTIYIYYGNPLATTTSDGDATFIFFDDFETDLSKWDGTDGCTLSTDYAYEGSKSLKTATGVSRVTKNTNYNSVAVHVKYYDRRAGTKEKHTLGCQGDTAALIACDEDFSTSYYVYRIGSTYYVSNVARSVGWHDFCIRVDGEVKEYVIDGKVQSRTKSEASILIIKIGSGWAANQTNGYFDACFVRKFVRPEPSHGEWGSEEVLKTPTALTINIILLD